MAALPTNGKERSLGQEIKLDLEVLQRSRKCVGLREVPQNLSLTFLWQVHNLLLRGLSVTVDFSE